MAERCARKQIKLKIRFSDSAMFWVWKAVLLYGLVKLRWLFQISSLKTNLIGVENWTWQKRAGMWVLGRMLKFVLPKWMKNIWMAALNKRILVDIFVFRFDFDFVGVIEGFVTKLFYLLFSTNSIFRYVYQFVLNNMKYANLNSFLFGKKLKGFTTQPTFRPRFI